MSERKFTPPTSFPAEFVTERKHRARILSDQGEGNRPFVGEYLNIGGEWAPHKWGADGMAWPRTSTSVLDLHDPVPTVATQRWLNIYPSGLISSHESRSAADRLAGRERIAVQRIDWLSDGTIRTEMEDV